MSKKLGPFPLWAWLVVAAVGGYIIYRRYSESASEGGEVEGYYPAERSEPNEGQASAGSGGGVSQLGEEISALREAGFVPAGSAESKAEPAEREVEPSAFEELAEKVIGERLAQSARRGRGRAARAAKAGAGRGAGKRAKATKRAPSNKRRHTHQPAHTASSHPRQRIAVAQARPAARRNQAQRRRKR